MQVPVRELKNNLSKYIHEVQAGEEVVVTSHNKPVVRIVAITDAEMLSRKQIIAEFKQDMEAHYAFIKQNNFKLDEPMSTTIIKMRDDERY